MNSTYNVHMISTVFNQSFYRQLNISDIVLGLLEHFEFAGE